MLRGITIEGNTVVPTVGLQALASDMVGTEVGVDDLEDLRRRLTRAYLDAGYVTSGAVLPDQTVQNGIVRYEILEGVLDEIEVLGTERLAPDHVTDRVRLAAGPPLNVNALQRKLRILLDDPLISRLDAELLPGLRPGLGRLRITVVEEPVAGVVVGVDNAIQPSVGGVQTGASMALRNLTGLGEIITVSPRLAQGFNEISGIVAVPLTPWDTTVSARGLYSRSRVVEEPFDVLDIRSETRELGVAISQPLYRAPGRTLTGSVGFDHRTSRSFLLDEPFSFSDGVRDGRSTVSVFRSALEWVDRSQDQVIAARAVLSTGVGFLGATENPDETPDTQFVAVLGQAQYVRRFEPLDLRLVVHGAGQWTEDRLLPLEKFGVGGTESVRGYRKDLLLGDLGWNASIELHIPVLETPELFPAQGGGALTLVPFVDAGEAWDVGERSPGVLVSAGAGVVWDLTDDAQANLFVGRGLQNRPDPFDESIQDIGVHFSVTAKLF